MVRTLTFVEEFSVTAQAVFSVGWANDTFLQSFHSTINGDSNPIIDPWQSGKRSINFKTPVNAPSLIKKAIGWDVIPVVEHQSVTQSPDDGSIVIECIPTPDIPGGGRFSTQVTFRIIPDTTTTTNNNNNNNNNNNRCQLKANLACSATGLGLLSGSIESFLVEAASGGMKDFISFLKSYIEELDSQGRLVGVLQPMDGFSPASPLVSDVSADAAALPEQYSTAALSRPMSAHEDEYFDASSSIDRRDSSGGASGAEEEEGEEEEEEEEDESIAGLVSRELQTVAAVAVPGGGTTVGSSTVGISSRLQFEEAVLYHLRTMSGKSDSTAAALNSITTRLDALESGVMKTRGGGEGYRLLLTACVAGLTGFGVGLYISNNRRQVGKM